MSQPGPNPTPTEWQRLSGRFVGQSWAMLYFVVLILFAFVAFFVSRVLWVVAPESLLRSDFTYGSLTIALSTVVTVAGVVLWQRSLRVGNRKRMPALVRAWAVEKQDVIVETDGDGLVLLFDSRVPRLRVHAQPDTRGLRLEMSAFDPPFDADFIDEREPSLTGRHIELEPPWSGKALRVSQSDRDASHAPLFRFWFPTPTAARLRTFIINWGAIQGGRPQPLHLKVRSSTPDQVRNALESAHALIHSWANLTDHDPPSARIATWLRCEPNVERRLELVGELDIDNETYRDGLRRWCLLRPCRSAVAAAGKLEHYYDPLPVLRKQLRMAAEKDDRATWEAAALAFFSHDEAGFADWLRGAASEAPSTLRAATSGLAKQLPNPTYKWRQLLYETNPTLAAIPSLITWCVALGVNDVALLDAWLPRFIDRGAHDDLESLERALEELDVPAEVDERVQDAMETVRARLRSNQGGLAVTSRDSEAGLSVAPAQQE